MTGPVLSTQITTIQIIYISLSVCPIQNLTAKSYIHMYVSETKQMQYRKDDCL